MFKIAIFVEGQTEQLFIRRLIEEIAGKNKIRIHSVKSMGGSTSAKKLTVIEAGSALVTQVFYALIVDCGLDSRVASEIRDQYGKLVASGYQEILGLRDVYPLKRTQIAGIRNAQDYKMPTKPFKPTIVLATMEVEAWFLAEESHFTQIDSALTADKIKTGLGVEFPFPDVEARGHPSEDLNAIYQLVQKSYTKNKKTVERTVAALDCAALYLKTVPSLVELLAPLDRFLATPVANGIQ